MRPPLWAYWATWVLPTSMTSGASLLARAAVTFSPMPSHSWIWIFTSISGWAFSKPVSNSFWNWAETLSRMSQTSRAVLPSPAPSAEPPDEEQAASPAPSTSVESRASERYFTVHLWESWKDAAPALDQ